MIDVGVLIDVGVILLWVLCLLWLLGLVVLASRGDRLARPSIEIRRIDRDVPADITAAIDRDRASERWN